MGLDAKVFHMNRVTTNHQKVPAFSCNTILHSQLSSAEHLGALLVA